MNKRVIAFLSILSFFVSLSLIPTNAAAKAGAKCTKAGSTEVVKEKSYTCIKSGKKLVWNKGVTSKKVGAAQPTLPTPTSFDDLVQNYEGIAYSAWSKSATGIKASTKTAAPFKALTGPNTKLAYKTPAYAFDLISRLYSDYETPTKMSVLSFNYQDRDWATEQMKIEVPNTPSIFINENACATKATCWGGGVFGGNIGNNYLLVLTTEVLDTNHLSGTLEAHEFTHVVQKNTGELGLVAPSWYTEGQAQFAQNASIYYQSFDSYLSSRRESSGELFRDPQFTSKFIEEFFVLTETDAWNKKYDRWRRYDLGAMLVEILTAISGPNSTMEIYKLTSGGVKFEDAFERVYKISFAKALPIMSKAIALELGRS
jgi:hypothetical protein